MRRMLAALLFLLVPVSAMADCQLDGQTYEEGASVGGYVCRGGQWV